MRGGIILLKDGNNYYVAGGVSGNWNGVFPGIAKKVNGTHTILVYNYSDNIRNSWKDVVFIKRGNKLILNISHSHFEVTTTIYLISTI